MWTAPDTASAFVGGIDAMPWTTNLSRALYL